MIVIVQTKAVDMRAFSTFAIHGRMSLQLKCQTGKQLVSQMMTVKQTFPVSATMIEEISTKASVWRRLLTAQREAEMIVRLVQIKNVAMVNSAVTLYISSN